MKRNTAVLGTLFMVLVGMLMNSTIGMATESGISGRTILGCSGNGCHPAQSTATSVSVQGVSGTTISMSPGENRSFTVLVNHASLPKAGADISIKNAGGTNVGTLSPVASLKLSGGDMTHTVNHPNITGTGAPFTFTWTAPTTPGDYFFRAVGNAINNNGNEDGDAWNFMSTITITVASAGSVALTAPNGGETLCRGASTNITWSPVGISGNVKLEYTTDGTTFTQIVTVPATPGSYTWNIPTSQVTGTNYKIRVSDVSNTAVNDLSNANFSILSTPVISIQPKSDSACPGNPLTLSVTTDNPTGYTYQWRKNSTNITGANATNYTITSIQASDAATYDVVITGCTPLTSTAVQVLVNAPPTITTQPSDQIVCPGSAVTFNASASGTGLSYQWKHNNINITGATNSVLTLPTTTHADSGSYSLVVTGLCAPLQTSNIVSLKFTPAPTISKNPRDTTVCNGASVTLSVTANGTGLTYQWQKDGVNVDGAQSNTLNLNSISNANAGAYIVIVKNSCNLTTASSSAILSLRESASITEQPVDLTIQTNLTATFTVKALGSNLKYQWMKNNVNRLNDTLPTLTINNVILIDSGNYKCIVRNECGNVESAVVKLTVTSPPAGAALALGTSTIDFGCTKVNAMHDTVLTNVIFNAGGQPLNVTGVALTGTDASDFTIQSGGGTFTLAPNEKRTLNLRFLPSNKTSKTAVLEFTSNTTTTSPKLTLIGKGCSGSIASDISNVGTTIIGSKKDTTVKICNSGDFELLVTSLTLGGTNSSDFNITLPTLPFVVKPGACIEVITSFTPTAVGKRTATLTVNTDAGVFTIPIEATSTPSTGVEESTVAGEVIVYPNPSSGNVIFTGSFSTPMPMTVRIFDALGTSTYQSLIDVTSAGTFSYVWDGISGGKRVSSGSYVAILTIGIQTIRVPFVIAR
ncbi:MAG: choice-of-anchor D domain-containing protein [Ignavibacteria bacterium]|nr:choice-of-anchor D domain-containing protein [Ignavibacteria bacterium]